LSLRWGTTLTIVLMGSLGMNSEDKNKLLLFRWLPCWIEVIKKRQVATGTLVMEKEEDTASRQVAARWDF
jgi:hypothetical protein